MHISITFVSGGITVLAILDTVLINVENIGFKLFNAPATALAIGGAGAIFWMWIAAFLGMATIYAEALMEQKYKTVGADGQVTGGTVY